MNISSLLIFILIIFIIFQNSKNDNFINLIYKKIYEGFFDTIPSKCYSCEKDMIKKKGKKYAYKGAPTKCFSCEQQNLRKNIPVELSNRTKCFSCQKNNNGPEYNFNINLSSRNDINNRV